VRALRHPTSIVANETAGAGAVNPSPVSTMTEILMPRSQSSRSTPKPSRLIGHEKVEQHQIDTRSSNSSRAARLAIRGDQPCNRICHRSAI